MKPNQFPVFCSNNNLELKAVFIDTGCLVSEVKYDFKSINQRFPELSWENKQKHVHNFIHESFIFMRFRDLYTMFGVIKNGI